MHSMDLISKDLVISSPFTNPNIPNCDLWTYIKAGFIGNGDKIALVSPEDKVSLTFSEVEQRVHLIAVNLIRFGYNPKTPFVICMSNSIEYSLTLFAIWRLGGTVALINQLLTSGEINKFLSMLDSEFMLCDNDSIGRSISACNGSSIKTLICKEIHPGCLSYSRLYKPDDQSIIFQDPPDIDPSKATAVIAFSSGTTGKPKAVELTHSCFVQQNSNMMVSMGRKVFRNGGIIYQPFSHVYGLIWVIGYASLGKRCVIMKKYDLEKYISLVSKYQIEILFLVPPTAVRFCKSHLTDKYDLSHLKVATCGAAAFSVGLEDELRSVLGKHVLIRQGYGMTELTCGVVRGPAYEIDIPYSAGSVGWPSPNTLIKVVDIETGKNLKAYTEGEVWVKCNYKMKGYLNNPEATTAMIDSHGWVHTGDIGYYDKNACLFIVDRLKELIKYKGYQVSPVELEGIILTHPIVADAAVTSVPDIEAGELPLAWVVLKPGKNATENEIVKFVNDKVAPFKKLRGGVKFVDSIPKSPSGKILRKMMKPTRIMSKL